jgi:predicted peptidase
MATRRDLFPVIAGVAGASSMLGVAPVSLAQQTLEEPDLRRVSYRSKRTGQERDYFVYLPPGHSRQKSWPVMLFLHGNGERGDAKGELDYVLAHGPLYEAWVQKRDLPFVIISPQLPMFRMGEVDYIKARTPAQIPRRMTNSVPPRPDERDMRLEEPMRGKLPEDKLPDGPEGPVDGWFELGDELIQIVDRTVANFRGDANRVYLTGLSYGGFGAWDLAARHPEKFAAVAPIVGYGHPKHAEPIAKAKLPVWCFAGGRDGIVPARYFYPALNELEKLGHKDVRFTNHEDLGHFTWVRVYGGQDLYSWLLTKSRQATA